MTINRINFPSHSPQNSQYGFAKLNFDLCSYTPRYLVDQTCFKALPLSDKHHVYYQPIVMSQSANTSI